MPRALQRSGKRERLSASKPRQADCRAEQNAYGPFLSPSPSLLMGTIAMTIPPMTAAPRTGSDEPAPSPARRGYLHCVAGTRLCDHRCRHYWAVPINVGGGRAKANNVTVSCKNAAVQQNDGSAFSSPTSWLSPKWFSSWFENARRGICSRRGDKALHVGPRQPRPRRGSQLGLPPLTTQGQ